VCMIPSKRMSCMVLLILSVEITRVIMYNMHGHFLSHNCSLALITYRIASGFLMVLFVSLFGLFAFENVSNVESLLKIQEELIRKMSHEMRTPIGVVRMSIEHVRTHHSIILCIMITV
jgi:signal transduction histidine kinase